MGSAVCVCERFTSFFANKLTVRWGASREELSWCIFKHLSAVSSKIEISL